MRILQILRKKLLMKLIKKLIYGCALLFCIPLFTFGYLITQRTLYNKIDHQSILVARETLKSISKSDQKALSVFFKTCVIKDSLAHTILGYKPMSLLCLETPEVTNDPKLQTQFRLALKGYEIFKHNSLLFPKKSYSIVEFENHYIPNLPFLLIIHHDCSRRLIVEHIEVFLDALGKSISLEDLFSILTNPNHEDFYTIMDSHFLKGILFGFGKTNAYLFENNVKERLSLFKVHWPFMQKWIHSPIKGNQIYFSCDYSTKETQELQKRYDEGAKVLYWTYFKRDFLETTLALFQQNPSSKNH